MNFSSYHVFPMVIASAQPKKVEQVETEVNRIILIVNQNSVGNESRRATWNSTRLDKKLVKYVCIIVVDGM